MAREYCRAGQAQGRSMMRDIFIPAVGPRRVRRRALLAAGAAGSSAWLLGACASGGKSSPSTPTSARAVSTANATPRRGGVLRAGQTWEPSFGLGGGAPIAHSTGHEYLTYAVLEQLVRYR